MIYERISSPTATRALGPLFARALEYLATDPFDSLPAGKTAIDGDDLFVLKVEYETYPVEKGVWETHRKYADVQVMIRGEERMGIGDPLSTLTVKNPYNEEDDATLLTGPGQFLHMKPGDIFVFFPEDPHMPGVSLPDKTGKVGKLVFKVRIA